MAVMVLCSAATEDTALLLLPLPSFPSLAPPWPALIVCSTARIGGWKCNKKLGVSGIECRCGYVFCGAHRYAGEHDCRFNYVREQQRKLLRENPALKRDKMDKL